MNKRPSAQIWVGSPTSLAHEVEYFLQQIFCSQAGCSVCSVCIQIRQRQHPHCLWFNPVGIYTLETIKPLFTIISRSLAPGEQFYFIFQHADYLSHACSNSLLKSIEEPPEGYHFIFLTQHEHALLPTVRSRCVITHNNKKNDDVAYEELLCAFTSKSYDFEFFLQSVEKITFDDRATQFLLEKIIAYWSEEYKKGSIDGDKGEDIERYIEVCTKAFLYLPMPGSAKMFWKNLFVQLFIL